MPKFILSIILLVLTLGTGEAATVTIGFENLQNVCGNNYEYCGTSSYSQLGISFSKGYVMRNTFPDFVGNPSIFPFGSYYLNINEGGAETTWSFFDPWTNAPRGVTRLEFVVLGKNGDVITDGPHPRPGTSGTSINVPNDRPNSRTCNVASDCPGYTSGAYVEALVNNNELILESIFDPIWYGEAGYATSPVDFANFRVVLEVPREQAFTSIRFTPSKSRDGFGNEAWGIIAIDQIEYDYVVPEPGTFVLPGFALAGLVWYQRRRAAAAKS